MAKDELPKAALVLRLLPSPALARIVGKEPMQRTEVIKRFGLTSKNTGFGIPTRNGTL